jgi:hypothetical protein
MKIDSNLSSTANATRAGVHMAGLPWARSLAGDNSLELSCETPGCQAPGQNFNENYNMTNIPCSQRRFVQPSPFTFLAVAQEKNRTIRIAVPPLPRKPFHSPSPEYLRAMREAELAVRIRSLKVKARGATRV